MNCSQCNTPLMDGTEFCPKCGTRVGHKGEKVRYFTSPKSMANVSLISTIVCVAATVVCGVFYANRPYSMDSSVELTLLFVVCLAPLLALIEIFQMVMRSKISICADDTGIHGIWPGAMFGASTVTVEPFRLAYSEIEAVETRNGRFCIQTAGKWKCMFLEQSDELVALIREKQGR